VHWNHYETALGLYVTPSVGISLFSRIYSCVSVELIKESLFGFAGHCNNIVPCSPVLSHVFRHTCSFCTPVQVVTFSHSSEYVFDNHRRFCLFAEVPFGILSFIMCINCCSQFCKDTLISLIGACQLVLSIKSQTLLKSASAYLHMGLG